MQSFRDSFEVELFLILLPNIQPIGLAKKGFLKTKTFLGNQSYATMNERIPRPNTQVVSATLHTEMTKYTVFPDGRF